MSAADEYYLPDLRFIPENLEEVNVATPLNLGVNVGTFIEGFTLDHLSFDDRKQLVRNLLPHAHILKSIRENQTQFKDYRLVVVEGIYKPSAEEQLTPDGQKDLATKGRSIVYELRKNGVTDNDKTYDLAQYISVYFKHYDKVILDYDTYDAGELNAQIIIETPEIPPDYKIKFKKVSQTLFNNELQSQGELVDVTETPQTSVIIPAPTVDNVRGFFTCGDIHSRLIRVYGGDPWQSFALDGKNSRDASITANIQKIAKGNTVVISVGQNDITSTNDSPELIAKRVRAICQASIDLNHVVIYLLPPKTANASDARNNAVRNEIANQLATLNKLAIEDLALYDLGPSGVALEKQDYISIAQKLIPNQFLV